MWSCENCGEKNQLKRAPNSMKCISCRTSDYQRSFSSVQITIPEEYNSNHVSRRPICSCCGGGHYKSSECPHQIAYTQDEVYIETMEQRYYEQQCREKEKMAEMAQDIAFRRSWSKR